MGSRRGVNGGAPRVWRHVAMQLGPVGCVVVVWRDLEERQTIAAYRVSWPGVGRGTVRVRVETGTTARVLRFLADAAPSDMDGWRPSHAAAQYARTVPDREGGRMSVAELVAADAAAKLAKSTKRARVAA